MHRGKRFQVPNIRAFKGILGICRDIAFEGSKYSNIRAVKAGFTQYVGICTGLRVQIRRC